MPAQDSPDVLVARYLRDHGYEATFQAFLQELNLEPSAISSGSDELTIEKVLGEKRLYDLSANFERTGLSEEDKPFLEPYPTAPLEVSSRSSNVLFVTVAELLLTSSRGDGAADHPSQKQACIISTTADRHMRIFSADDGFELLRETKTLHVAPILSVVAVDERRLLSASMSGEIVLSDADTGDVIDRRKDHTKYVVKLSIWKENDNDDDDARASFVVATAGYDKKVTLYRLPPFNDGTTSGLEIISKLELQATVEEVFFTKDYRNITTEGQTDGGDTGGRSAVMLALTVRDSPYLEYYKISNNELRHSHKYALSANSTSWAVFSAMNVAPNPHKPHMLAIATSSVPDMKLVILDQRNGDILQEVFTTAPQGLYSNAVLAWRPDGSGLWLNSDDGIIRGVAPRTGKIKAELRKHTSKVRTLWAGHVKGRGEVLLSGSFDTRLVLWSTE